MYLILSLAYEQGDKPLPDVITDTWFWIETFNENFSVVKSTLIKCLCLYTWKFISRCLHFYIWYVKDITKSKPVSVWPIIITDIGYSFVGNVYVVGAESVSWLAWPRIDFQCTQSGLNHRDAQVEKSIDLLV